MPRPKRAVNGKLVTLNVEVEESTRDKLNVLARIYGTQGAALEALIEMGMDRAALDAETTVAKLERQLETARQVMALASKVMK